MKTNPILAIIISVMFVATAGAFDIDWDEHIIDGDFSGAYNVYAIDLDGDDDVDVLGAARYADDITWWENDGNQNFTKHTIYGDFDGANSVFAIDLDGDNDVDVLGAAGYADDITWWENDGNQIFTEHTIYGDFDGANSVFAIDLDGDNDVDVLGTAGYAYDITWWENDGNQNFTWRTINVDYYGARSVYAIDLDGDGDVDVLGAASYYIGGSEDITWWENDGNQNFTRHSIDASFGEARSVHAIDLDNDNDVDVLGAGSKIVCWENDGNQNFTKHIIDGNPAYSVCAIDLDGDNDVDVLGAAYIANDITWWENDGSQNFTEHTIDGNFDGAISVYAIDLDEDNDVDVLGAGLDDDEITWWESFLSPEISNIEISNLTSVSATISWTTGFPANGYVHYGLTTDFSDTLNEFRSNDDVHIVKITGLSPTIPYYFEVVSGGTVDSNGGSYYTFTTTEVGIGVPYLIAGRVYFPDSITPAEGTLISVEVKSSGGDISYPLAALADTAGFWLLNLGNLKDTTTNDVFSYSIGDSIFITANGADDGRSSAVDTVSGTSPQDCGIIHLYNTIPAISNVVNIPESPCGNEDCEVSAIIRDTLVTTWVNAADLYYNGSGYGVVTMSNIADSFYATIPGQPARTTVYYYISAKDNLGDSTVSDTFSYYVQPDTCLTCEATIISQRVPDVNGDIFFDLQVNNCGFVSHDVGSEMYPTIGDCASGTQYDFDIIRLLTSNLAPSDSFSGYYSYHIDDVSGSGLSHCALNFNVGPTVDNWYATCCDEFYFTRSWGRSTGSRNSFFEGNWLSRDDQISLPTTTALNQNYPNPFNPTTTIEYQLSEPSHVTLEIYNILGAKVSTLVDKYQDAEYYNIEWDASTYSSGIYFYKLTTDRKTLTKRMTLLK
ncbi:MAG: T9SS type A sorting domain-containing protein [bacterium]|nr:T9SS type A sorting domain-containing protein [bacterium]